MRIALSIALAACISCTAHAASPEPFAVAVTVDDLPVHGKLPPGMTWLGIAEAHVKLLKAHGVPEAFGFVNAAKLDNTDDGAATLDAWRKAGYPLGNHTFTHLNMNQAGSLDAWLRNVEQGEPAVASRMQGADWRFLRLPNLAVSAELRDAAFGWLKQRGYRIADVSLAFSDWDYTDAYARCVAKNDSAAIAAMKEHYLQGVDQGIANMKEQSKQVYGRIIPQVLLTHMGGFSAVTLDEVLKRLDAAGARYITLAEAQADPAYTEAGGGSIITRTARAKGIKLKSVPDGRAPIDVRSFCK